MSDDMNRQELSQKLKRAIDKTASKITRKYEAEKGDFKVEISKYAVNKYHKGKLIESQDVRELDDELHEVIQADAEEAAYGLLKDFQENFSVEADRSASANTENITKEAEESKPVQKEAEQKEAANQAVDKETAEVVTQKQMDKMTESNLHERTGYNPDKITQRQLAEDGEQGRAGTYDVITQAQLDDEKDTFYSEPLIAASRDGEDRNTITEDQFDKGVGEYADAKAAENDRGEMGAKYDGGVDAQDSVIGEKQLRELLSHHEYTTPLTVTEDQLTEQDGELARITAEIADKILKEAITMISKTSLSAGVRPEKVIDTIRQLTSHDSKLLPFADTIRRFVKASTKSIEDKVADCRWGGKTANINTKPSDYLVADILIRQLSKLSYNPMWIVKGLKNLANDPSIAEKIEAATTSILAQTDSNLSKEADEDDAIFRSVLAGKTSDKTQEDKIEGSAKEDGLYRYRGALDEIEADVNDKDKFMTAAAEHSKKKVLANIEGEIELTPTEISVDKDKGEFTLTLRDASFQNKGIEARAAKRRELAKEAQVPAGGMGAGPEMGGMANPAAPPGAADMGMGAAPPPEALGAEPPMEEDVGGEAKPPGSVCGMCGSEDVDIDNGEIRCNSCGSEGEIAVQTKWKKIPGIMKDEAEGEEGGFELGEEAEAGLAGEEELAGAGTTLPNVPVGASVKITPFTLQKLAENKITPLEVCPNCGSNKTHRMKSAHRKGDDAICWDCGNEYSVRVLANKKKKHDVHAQFFWTPITKDDTECTTCSRLKVAFVNSLKNYGMTWDEFDALPSMKEKADTILKMSKVNALNIKEAMNEPISVEKYAASSRWSGYDKFDKFPLTSCKERINRRFGENATAMSGPCEGAQLADCVCGQLDNLGIYTDGLAAKVASRHMSEDPMLSKPTATCVAMLVRDGYDIKPACTVCDALKAAYASVEDLIIETVQSQDIKQAQFGQELADDVEVGSEPGVVEHDVDVAEGPEGVAVEETTDLGPEMPGDEMMGPELPGDDMMGDMDMGEDYVTVKIPVDDIAKALERALQGGLTDDMIDTTGDMEIDELGDDMGVEEEIPGLDEESSEVGDELIKGPEEEEGSPEDIAEDVAIGEAAEEAESGILGGEDKDCSAPMEAPAEEAKPACKPCGAKPMETSQDQREVPQPKPMAQPQPKPMVQPKPMKAPSNIVAETEETMTKQASADELEEMLIHMKQGTIAKESSSLDFLVNTLTKSAKNDDIKKMERKDAKEKKIKETPAQDTSDIGDFKDGGTIGAEDKFTDDVADGPDVPRKDQLLGKEEKDKTISEDGDKPSIPVGDDMPGETKSKDKSKTGPEKQDETDPNQGGNTKNAGDKKAVKTAEKDEKDEKDGKDGCTCDPKKKCFTCGAPCYKCCGCRGKKADSKKYKVTKSHKLFNTFQTKLAENKTVKLEDGNHYSVVAGKKDVLFLVQSEKNEELKKESDTKTVNRVESLEDDPDLKAGYDISADKPHSLGVDEKAPSEGVKSPEVPSAPNDGRLTREHTVDKAKDLPEIPAGGGMTPGKDENEKNMPEKQEEILGKQNDTAATASDNRDRATKIAGRMLKENKISVDELTAKIDELSTASTAILNDYEKMLGKPKVAETDVDKGMKKEATADAVETTLPVTSAESANQDEVSLAEKIASLTRLEQQNRDWEQYLAEKNEN